MKYAPMTIPSPAQLVYQETQTLIAKIYAQDENKNNTIHLKLLTESAKMSKNHPEDTKNARARSKKDI